MRISLKERNRITLPKEVIPEGAKEFEVEKDEQGRIVLTPLAVVPLTQAYYWSESWQKGERQAHEEARTGHFKDGTVDDVMKEVRGLRKRR